jgi:hypothetical protein
MALNWQLPFRRKPQNLMWFMYLSQRPQII